MKNKNERSGFTPQENLVSILPSVVAGLIMFSAVIIANLVYFLPEDPFYKAVLIIYGIGGILYLSLYYFIYTASLNKSRFSWVNTVIASIVFCSMVYFFPEKIDQLLYILILIATLSSSLISTRGPAYFLIFSVTSFYFLIRYNDRIPDYEWIIHFGLIIAAVMGVETIQQLKNIAKQQINRLELINDLSKQIVTTLDTKQVFSLLDIAFKNALEADSYYIGVVDDDQLHLELLHDDGEYYHDLQLNKKGTLANWVITHQKELFLPDLR
jgi:K+-sensing histidine kinase KdpD